MTEPLAPATQAPAPPTLTYAFTVQLAFRDRLNTPALSGGWSRGSITITGGTFEGPDIRGIVLPGGGDAPLVRPDGVALLDARYLLETHDGVRIHVINRGMRRASAGVAQRLAENEDSVAATEYYLRTTPVFEVEPGPYEWLANHLFVGSGRRVVGGNVIDYFRVN